MSHVIGRVRVKDFDRFIETFTTRGAELRAKHGSRGAQVYRVAGDANAVVTLFDWDQADLQGFLDDPEAHKVMEAAGLEARPEFTFVELVRDVDA